ncbi:MULTISPECIES: flagellin [Clostridium]|uniref:flagellin N-terminal helical domain-containing protein n=1 Tax=Clostridium TaxID=1485 RepID=UPI00082620EA|nr:MULTISPECIES: flagellin [Clostridium]PJI07453.1 flagellin [Clostridium sp. CT7]
MIIGHNLAASKVLYFLNINQMHMQKAMFRLSTGKRINSAADDPAGLTISEHMQAQINSLDAASRNTQNSICMLQTAEGGLNETQSILQRMNELATQAANGTNSPTAISGIKSELSQLEDEISHICNSTNFNGINLLGSSSNLNMQIGATDNSYDKLSLNLSSFNTAKSLASIINGGSINVDNVTDARNSISVIQNAIDEISSSRSLIGAYENRLNYSIDNLNSEEENLTSAESKITDADMAKEILQYSKYSLLQQVARAMMSQALHQEPNSVLKLLDSL